MSNLAERMKAALEEGQKAKSQAVKPVEKEALKKPTDHNLTTPLELKPGPTQVPIGPGQSERFGVTPRSQHRPARAPVAAPAEPQTALLPEKPRATIFRHDAAGYGPETRPSFRVAAEAAMAERRKAAATQTPASVSEEQKNLGKELQKTANTTERQQRSHKL